MMNFEFYTAITEDASLTEDQVNAIASIHDTATRLRTKMQEMRRDLERAEELMFRGFMPGHHPASIISSQAPMDIAILHTQLAAAGVHAVAIGVSADWTKRAMTEAV